MNEQSSSELFLVLLAWIALVLPALMIWGWRRWYKTSVPGTLSSKFSLGGFVFANISVVLGLSVIVFAHGTGSSPLYNKLLLRLYSFGLVLSVLSIVLSLAGLRRRSPLRWPGLLCAGGVLAFWLFTQI